VASSVVFTENEHVLFSGIMHVPYSVRRQLVQTPETRSMHALRDDDPIYISPLHLRLETG